MNNQKSVSKYIEALIFGVLGIALCAYAFIEKETSFVNEWSQSPYLFPLLVGGIIVVLAFNLILQARSHTDVHTDTEDGEAPKQNKRGIVVVLLITLIYMLAIQYIDIPKIVINMGIFALRLGIFEWATIVFLFVFLKYLNVKSKKVLIILPITSVIVISFCFRTLLNVLLP